MKKLRSSLLIAAVLLAFPLWFYAEMKHADKHLEHLRNSESNTEMKKNAVAVKSDIMLDTPFATLPFFKGI